jgi:hypothetical protein
VPEATADPSSLREKAAYGIAGLVTGAVAAKAGFYTIREDCPGGRACTARTAAATAPGAARSGGADR